MCLRATCHYRLSGRFQRSFLGLTWLVNLHICLGYGRGGRPEVLPSSPSRPVVQARARSWGSKLLFEDPCSVPRHAPAQRSVLSSSCMETIFMYMQIYVYIYIYIYLFLKKHTVWNKSERLQTVFQNQRHEMLECRRTMGSPLSNSGGVFSISSNSQISGATKYQVSVPT